MRRREFITLVGGVTASAIRSFTACAQATQMHRVGVLVGLARDDPEMKARLDAFRQGLEKRGWLEGRNVIIDTRFAPDSTADQAQVLAKELIALKPNVLFVQTTPLTAALQRETRIIPIVFAGPTDPVGSGFVASLPRPGGNLTGLMLFEASVTGKWLTMLKEIAPRLERAAFLINPKTAPYYNFYLGTADSLSPALGIKLVPSLVEGAGDIERAIGEFARAPDGGLVLPPDINTVAHRDLIIALAARYRLPTVAWLRTFVVAGGLMSYGVDYVEMSRQAAYYIDRILRGDKPADLPVQATTKFETTVNLKTAKALGLSVPPGLLVAADEVIE